MNDKFWIELFEEHIPEITKWANEKLALSANRADEETQTGFDIVRKLPDELQVRLRNKHAFRCAFRKGLIAYKPGEWEQRFDTKSVFAYFLGRCFSNDYVSHDIFERGQYPFPAHDLEKLFGVANLRDSRKFMLNKKISRRCKDIDSLFDN